MMKLNLFALLALCLAAAHAAPAPEEEEVMDVSDFGDESGMEEPKGEDESEKGIIAEFPIGSFTLQFEVKQKDEFYDFCLRVPLVGRAAKGCVGLSLKKNAKGEKELHLRVRAGSKTIYTRKFSNKYIKKISTCTRAIKVLSVNFGKMCLKDVEYLSSKGDGCTRRKVCLTVASTGLKKGAKVCTIFCDASFEKFSHKWVTLK